MGVRTQHVKSADILHVRISYPPRAQAYSPTTAANFLVFWTRCQWLIKHTAYHLHTALTLFLSLIFKSSRTSVLSRCWPRKKKKKRKFGGAHTSLIATAMPRLGGHVWPGGPTQLTCFPGRHVYIQREKRIRSQFQRVMGRGRRS